MWPLFIAMFAMAMLTIQQTRTEPTGFEASRDSQNAQQALVYASAVATYLRSNPGASSPATTAQLNLPSWYPLNCNGTPCFNHGFAGGRAYITAKSGISLRLGAIYKAQDGSIMAGTFSNISTGTFQSQYGVVTLPVPAGASTNTPTIVVGP